MPESVPDGSTRPLSSSTYFDSQLDQQLEQLASSVPNLAATLGTQEEEDNENDNIRFLRSELFDDEPSNEDHTDRLRRIRRAADTSNEPLPRVYTPAQLEELGNRQDNTYNGWAPGATLDDERPVQSSAALLEEHVRDRMRLRRLRDAFQSEWRETDNNALHEHIHREQPNFSENTQPTAPTVNESSLRTTALLQAVRRSPQFSDRSRMELQRYILDRERGDDRDRNVARIRPQQPSNTMSPSQRRQLQREAAVHQEMQEHRSLLSEYQQNRNFLEEQLRRQRQQRQERQSLPQESENQRRRYWQAPQTCTASDRKRVEDAIKYLGNLRFCDTEKEGREIAKEAGFCFSDLPNTQRIASPPESSWLQIGSILSGTQHAANAASLHNYSPLIPPSIYRARARPQFGSAPPRNPSPIPQPSVGNGDGFTCPEEERWPVKVTIHGIDYQDMTLSGTMEAFNVPDKSSPTKVSSITTYLEGEIIDFNKFSLETESFKADTRVDGLYWRKLPPFKDLTDDETMVQRILNQEWLQTELMEKWILMRWKEKCFVTPSDAQTALTISGFYYVSLERANGHVEGLYYDPHSNPYQHLSLTPEHGRTFPAYTFT